MATGIPGIPQNIRLISLMSKTKWLCTCVVLIILNISSQFSAKQREMTKFLVFSGEAGEAERSFKQLLRLYTSAIISFFSQSL